jgi:hypothetical protein
MPILTQIIIVAILVLTCIAAAFVTGYNSRVIRREIDENKTRLVELKRDSGKGHRAEIANLEKSLTRLKEELAEVEGSILFPSPSNNAPLYEKVRSALPYIIMIIIGVVVGAVVIVLVPVIILVVLFTVATFLGSSGVLLEFTRSEKKVMVVSTIPAALYALTQILNILGLFDLVFWLFDIVVVFALIGVSMILGRELPIEVIIIIIVILSVWDIYAVLFSRIMFTAVISLEHTVFSVQIPVGTGYGLIGGGDLFFSYLLVTAFTRRLKQVPLVLIGLITFSFTGLTVIMYVSGLGMAPALPSVLLAGLLSVAYYYRRLARQA